MPPENSLLAEYQEALMGLLLSGLPQEEIVETLKTDPRFEQYRDYLATFDPDMVGVACELMEKWAKKK